MKISICKQHVKKRQAVQKRIHLQRRQVQRLVMSVNHTKIHKPKRCAKCGGNYKNYAKMISWRLNIQTTSYITASVDTPQVEISVGKNLMTVILSLQEQNYSLNSIKEIVNLTDVSLCKKTIQNIVCSR